MPKCSRWTSMVVGLSTTVSCRSTPQPRYSRWSSCLSSDCTSPRNAVVPFSLSCRDFHFCRSSHVLGPLCCCFVLLFFKSRSFFFFFIYDSRARTQHRPRALAFVQLSGDIVGLALISPAFATILSSTGSRTSTGL